MTAIKILSERVGHIDTMIRERDSDLARIRNSAASIKKVLADLHQERDLLRAAIDTLKPGAPAESDETQTREGLLTAELSPLKIDLSRALDEDASL
jgi:hypothetical protein